MTSLVRAVSIDYRSLRFCRAAMGLMLLVHALHLIYNFNALLTDEGIIPFSLVTDGGVRASFSFFDLSHAPWMAGLHLGLLILCAFGLVANRFPRSSSLVGYILILSLNNRFRPAWYGVDFLIPTILLWLSFLPPGPPVGDARRSFSSLASLCVLAQIAYLYIFAGLLKSDEYWFTQGRAAYTALQADLYARPLGSWLAVHAPYWLLQMGSRAVLLWERFGPLLIFSPVYFPWCRMFVFLGFAMMHLQFAATMAIGTFPGFDLAFLILLVPGEIWDEIERRLPHLPPLQTFRRVQEPLDFFAPVILAAMFCITVWNLKRLEFRVWVPGWVKFAAANLSLNQNWGMFAPTPFSGDGWYVVQGTMRSGHPVDLLREKKGWADFRKPRVVSAQFPSERWVSYTNSLQGREGEAARLAFASYFCRRGGQVFGEPLREVRIWFVAETTVAKNEFQPVFSRLKIAKNCLE